MPTLYLLTWNNSNVPNTYAQYITYAAHTDIIGAQGTFQDLNAAASSNNFVISTNTTYGSGPGYIFRYNIFYDFKVSAKCTTQAPSPEIVKLDNIKWLTPSTQLLDNGCNISTSCVNPSTPLADWGYVSTNKLVSVWFDSIDLKRCLRIDIQLFASDGVTPIANNAVSFPATSGVFPDNLKSVVFQSGLTADTNYKVKLILYAKTVGGQVVTTSTLYNVYTKPASSSYTQWIVTAGDVVNDPCNIKYQFVVQAQPTARAASIQTGTEHLLLNYLTNTQVGGLHPYALLNMSLNHIKLIGGSNSSGVVEIGSAYVYEYNALSSIFDAITTTQCI
jgi:hypothetical protein